MANNHQAFERGSALVEMALALPFLVLLLVGAVDYGRILYFATELDAAARAGAQYASVDLGHFGYAAGIRSAAVAAAPDLSLATTDITIDNSHCICAPDSPTTQADFTAAASCSATCTGGKHLMVVVKVSAAKNFSVLTRLLPVNRTPLVTRVAWARVAY